MTDSAEPGSDDPVAAVLSAARRFANAWASPDEGALAAVHAARELARTADDALRAGVERARMAGHTWQELGDLLGTTRQAAFQRFGRPVDPRTGEPVASQLLPDAVHRAATLFADYVEGRYETIIAQFAEPLIGKLDAAQLSEGWLQLGSLFGRYEGLGEPFAHPLGERTIVDVPVRFETGDLVGRVTYDPDGRISGFFVLRKEFA